MIRVKAVEVGTKYADALRLSFRYNAEYVAKIKRLRQRWYIPTEREWEIPRSELINLINLVGVELLELDNELRQSLRQEVSSEGQKGTQERLENNVPIIPFTFKTTPFPHQIEGFNAGIRQRSLLLADEQGLGKTKQSIDISVALRNLGKINKALIVCGINGVKYNWQREVRIHSDERATVFDGKTRAERVRQIDEWIKSEDILFGIINIEALRQEEIATRFVLLTETRRIGIVIVDEIHKAKNGESQQGKALRQLKPMYRIGLTGTPITNRVEDLWNILAWLGIERDDKWGFYRFRNRYCVKGGFQNKQIVGYKNLAELNARLSEVMLRRKKAEVLDLPPKLRQVEYVELSSEHRQAYNTIRQGIIGRLDELETVPNPLTALLRLRQCTSGLIGEENPKLDRLKELLNEDIVATGQKAIIYSQWEQVTEKLRAELREYNPAYVTGSVKDRDAQIERFQTDANCSVIIGTIGALGTGWTLTQANYVIFVDRAWTPADNEQAEDRAHRIGTTGTVNIITLVAQNTIDERIEEILTEKRELFEQVVEGRITSSEDRRELLTRLLGIEA